LRVERYLKLKEYSELSGIGRSTVFDWIKTGKLKEGVHYIRFGGSALRFPFPQCLEAPLEEALKKNVGSKKSRNRPRRTSKGSGVNLGYGA